ncbi:MAG: ATP-binding protein [Myxococcota bacterium]
MQVLTEAGIRPEAFFESAGLDYEHVRNFENRISWSEWIRTVDALEERLGGEGSFEQHFRLGNTLAHLESTRILQKFAGLFTGPQFMYRVLWRWFGPSMFPGVESRLTTAEARRLVGEIVIPEGWDTSPAFFRLNRAVMIEIPRLVGSGPARIDLEIHGRRGIFEIHLPPSGSLWSRAKSAIKSTFFKDAMLRELEAHNEALVESYQKLEQKRQELVKSAGNFRALTEQSTDSIAVVCEGELAYANPAMARFLEYDEAEDLRGKPIEDILVEGAAEALIESQDVEQTNPFDPRADVLFRTKYGEVVRGDVNRVEMEFEGVPSVMLISRDVTERRELAARMMQMDRMIAVGTLAAGVAHEINNPLTYVVTNTDFSRNMLGQVRDDIDALDSPSADKLDEIRRKLDLIDESLADAQHGGKRVTSIVRDLRTFSRDSDQPNRLINVDEVVTNAIKMGWHELRDTVELVQKFEASQPAAIDPSRLSQVVLNILINAAHAIQESPEGQNKVWIRTWDADDQVCIEVRDTGVGIRDEHLDRILDPFFTTKPVGKGTGLGLSICKNLLEDMGGDLSISSELGQGTTVKVTLPAREPAEGLHAESSFAVDASAFSGSSILVVDDDPLIGDSITRLLRTNCDITTVQSGREALVMLEREQPVLVLCDILMDEMNGLEFFSVLEREHPELTEKFVFMSAGTFSDFDTDQLERFGRPVLTKPFTLTDLHDAFRDAL